MRVHLQMKRLECSICAQRFNYHKQRHAHMLRVHGIAKTYKAAPNMYICDVCEKRFPRKNTLAEHMVDVHIEKSCYICDLKFSRRKYKLHLNEAHNIPIPTCGVCGFKHASESKLIQHQRRVHLKEKNLACTLCEMKFYSQTHLKSHMLKHTTVRNYSCEDCGKKFARKQTFEQHRLLHSGVKSYKCEICEVAYAQRGSLYFHNKTRHSLQKQS